MAGSITSYPSPHNSGSEPGSVNRSNDPDDVIIDIRSILLMLWRRKYIIFGIILVGILFTIVMLSYIKPHYTARSLVLIETGSQQSNIPQELQVMVSSYLQHDTSVILNEIEVIRSRVMAQKVIERLDLYTDPDLNASYARSVESSRTSGVKSDDSFKSLNVYGEELDTLPREVLERKMSNIVTNFLKNLDVRALSGSYAIQIQYTSSNPKRAALIANTVADVYIEERLQLKFEAGKKLTNWLDERLTELREQVRTSERAAAEYRAKNNITEGIRNIITAEQISQLNSQLISAKAKKAEAEARLKQITSLEKSPSSIETSTEILSSSFIQRLKQQESEIQKTLSDLAVRYGAKHPDMIKLKGELAEIRKNLRLEMNKIAESLKNEVEVADARYQALSTGLDELRDVRNIENEKMIKLNELLREAESNRLIFDTFLQTYKRSDDQEKLQEPEARVISYAVTPSRPSYPDKPLFLSLVLAFSLFLGVFISFLLEKLDNTFRSPNQLEKSAGFPCFALIPSVENMSQQQLVRYVVERPSSTVAEAVRTLRTVLNLRGANNGKKPKVITITSSFPGEGKTTLSCWLSRLAAKSGDKVILIDGDLRRPNVHRALGQDNTLSLVEYLTGKNTLEEVLQKDEATGLHVVCGKSVPNSALDLISSDKMHKLVEALSEEYDLVVLDTPACLAVSDARIMASMSDQTVYSVAWDSTPREVVLGGVKQFSDMGYTNVAFTLTNVDIKRHVRYGYGDTVYYYGSYKEDAAKAS